jgi:hypothetical protein
MPKWQIEGDGGADWLSGLGSQAPLLCLPLAIFLLPKTYIRVCTQTHTQPLEEE